MRKFKKRSIIIPIFGGLAFFVLGLNIGMIVGKDMAKEQIEQQTPNKGVKTDSLDYNAIIEKLSIIESNNKANAIGDNGLAFGILQIHDIAVKEHNNQFGTNYTHNDCFNPEIAKLITENLLRVGAEMHLEKCGVPANESDLVRMHNGGIYSGANKVSTLKYLQDYYKI